MKTRELAEILAEESDADIIEARLLHFLANDYSDGYSERLNERAIADRKGCYWLPCILCGTWHGGHEPDGGSIMITRSGGTMVCKDCKGQTKRINDRWPNGISEVLSLIA